MNKYFDQFLKKTTELIAQGESFVTATVVRCQPPTSGKPGDKAIVQGDEITWGWIGGGCAQPVVVKEALKALDALGKSWCASGPFGPGRDAGEGIVETIP